jgi:formate C-acetyltransferase
VGFFPETAGAWLRSEIDTLSNRQWDPYEVTSEQIKEIKKIMPYWQGKTLFDIWSKACPSAVATKVINTGWADSTMSLFTNGFHFTPPWELILKNGICWYESKVKEALDKIDNADPGQIGKEHFYQALLLVITAAKNFANKYS